MMEQQNQIYRWPHHQAQRLIEFFIKKSYQVIAPTVRDRCIVYDQIQTVDQLPRGKSEKQEKGQYELIDRSDGAYFGYALGPYSWRKFLDPPREKIFEAIRKDNKVEIIESREKNEKNQPKVLFGVRSCEAMAIKIQDKIFMGQEHQHASYTKNRQNALLVGVNCHHSAPTCFCVSMKTGPHHKQSDQTGLDLVFTEYIADKVKEGTFSLQAFSSNGKILLDQFIENNPPLQVDPKLIIDQQLQVDHISKLQTRKLNDDPKEIQKLLWENPDHAYWDKVANECLSCANCTMVCPTCFCSTVEDVTDITGEHAERWKRWDSCFTADFTYLHGGPVRENTKSRYRQWLTHKLSTWHDQFDTSGCVGCGRCITWCPVGIDLTEVIPQFKQQ